jgi:outer membrane biosynthesis protein TonB
LAIALLLSMVALPLVERTKQIELPERVAKLVRKERTPPPPPVEQPVIPEEQIPEPEPELVEELPPEPLPQSSDEPALAEVQQPDTREQVKSKGILAFRDSFASRADLRPTAQLGSQARMRNSGENSVGRPERMMVTTSAPGSSGGINLASISRDFGGGGGGGEGVELSRMASSIGGGDGPYRPLSGGASAGRTDEEIQIVFDRYKAALYRLYNRELRKDPTLRGQLVLQLTIEPDGTVSLCNLHSSDMDAPLLANQVVDRVRTFDFGAKEDIVAVTIIYPIDFLPAA